MRLQPPQWRSLRWARRLRALRSPLVSGLPNPLPSRRSRHLSKRLRKLHQRLPKMIRATHPRSRLRQPSPWLRNRKRLKRRASQSKALMAAQAPALPKHSQAPRKRQSPKKRQSPRRLRARSLPPPNKPKASPPGRKPNRSMQTPSPSLQLLTLFWLH